MTLSATSSKTFQSQTLLEIVKSAKAQNKLPQGEELKLSGPTVSFEDLKQQCEGHPELEALVQDFIDHPDKYEKGKSTASHQAPAKSVSFGGQPASKSAYTPGTPLLKQDAATTALGNEITKLRDREAALSANLKKGISPAAAAQKVSSERDALRTQILAQVRKYEGMLTEQAKAQIQPFETAVKEAEARVASAREQASQAGSGPAGDGARAQLTQAQHDLEARQRELKGFKAEFNARTSRSELLAMSYEQTPASWTANQGTSELDVLKRNLALEAGTMAKLMQQTDPKAYAREVYAQKAKLKEGMNAVYAKLMTAPLESLRRLPEIVKSGQPPTELQQHYLKLLGLDLKNGQVLNSANGQAISGDSLTRLLETADAVYQSTAGLSTSREAKAVNVLRNAFLTAESRSHDVALRGRMAAVDQADTETNQIAGEVETQQQDIQRDQEQGSKLEAEAQVVGGLITIMTDILPAAPPHKPPSDPHQGQGEAQPTDAAGKPLPDTSTQGEPVQIDVPVVVETVKALPEAKLSELNAAIAPQGLEIARSASGELSYKQNDAPVSAQTFWQAYAAKVTDNVTRLSGIEAEMHAIETGLPKKISALERSQAQLAEARAGLGKNHQALVSELAEAKETIRNIKAQLADPNAGLSAEERKSLEEELAALEASVKDVEAKMPAVNERVRKTEERAERAQARASETIERAKTETLPRLRKARQRLKNMMLHWQSMLPRLGEFLDKLMQVRNPTPVQKLAEDALRKLIDRADELENDYKRALAPVPNNEKLYEFTDKLRLLIEETQAQFETLQASQQEADGVQKKISGDHFTKQIEQGAYHAKKLKQISASQHKLSPAELQDLSAALKHVKGSLFMNQSLQAKLAS